MWLCDIGLRGFWSMRDFALFSFVHFPVLVSFSPLLLGFTLLERLAKVEYWEHSPAGLEDVCVIASCIAAGFEIPFASVWAVGCRC